MNIMVYTIAYMENNKYKIQKIQHTLRMQRMRTSALCSALHHGALCFNTRFYYTCALFVHPFTPHPTSPPLCS